MVVQSGRAVERVSGVYAQGIGRVNLYRRRSFHGIQEVRNARRLPDMEVLTAKCR
jgi:hypothetical protein